MKTVFFVIIVLPVFFCKQIKTNGNMHSSNPYDSIIKDIPKYKDGGFSAFYRENIQIAKVLKLYDLETGFDSLQIRIWYPDWAISSILILSRYPDRWEATIQKFESIIDKQNPKEFKVEYKSISSKKVNPKSQWSILLRKLIELDITVLPDSNSLPGSPGAGADGEGYSVEISTKKKYRFYTYSNPFLNRHIPEVDKMSKIIELLNDEFPEIIK